MIHSCIMRRDLQKYVITNYFDNRYHENIDFAKQILKNYFTFSTKKQGCIRQNQYVKYRDDDI